MFFKWRDYLVIVGVAVVAQGLLALNDGTYWDDWIHVVNASESTPQRLIEFYAPLGNIPFHVVLFWIFAHLPGGFTQNGHAFVFACLSGAGLFAYSVARESGFVGRAEALAIGCLWVAYPGIQSWVAVVDSTYAFELALFMFATLLALRAEGAVGRRRMALFAASVACFFISFETPSLFVWYIGALALLVLVTARQQGLAPATWPLALPRLVLTRWNTWIPFICAPIVFWLINITFFTHRGILHLNTYTSFTLTATSIKFSANQFLIDGIEIPLKGALDELGRHPIPWVAALVVALGSIRLMKTAGPSFSRSSAAAIGLLAFGLCLLGLGVLPYVAVGFWPAGGWLSRHNLLVGPSMAVILTAAVRLLFPSRRGSFSTLGIGVLVSVLIGYSLVSIGTYVSWEARWAHDRSVMQHLSQLPGAANYSVYMVDDRDFISLDPIYRDYEWAAMFSQVWGGESRAGNQISAYGSNLAVLLQDYGAYDLYNMRNLDPRGCQATLTIERGTNAPSATMKTTIGLDYLRARFLGGDMAGYLDGLTLVSVTPLPSPEATDCH
jgi:hypothetical protein